MTLAATDVVADEAQEIAASAFELRVSGQVDEAVQLLNEGLADHPESGILHYELARTQLLLLDIPAMYDEAEAAVSCAPHDGDFGYFAAMGSAYALIDAAHKQDQARLEEMGRRIFDHLETVLADHPGHHEARYLLVQQSVDTAPEVGVEVGDLQSHVQILEREDPVLGAKARCCLVDDQERRAIWEALLADRPDDNRASREAAVGFIEIGDLERAGACVDHALADGADAGYELLQLGLAHAMRKDWDQALELTRRYLELDQPPALRAFGYARQAMIQHQMGDADRASELMAEAREIDPHVWRTMMPPPREIFTPPAPTSETAAEI
jgi:tetratricopeptide (TPR) repeat protein